MIRSAATALRRGWAMGAWRRMHQEAAVLALEKESIRLTSDEDDTAPFRVSNSWLRDNCRCPTCYNEKTNQRRLEPTALLAHVRPVDARIVREANELCIWEELNVTWDDNHHSAYPLPWLRKLATQARLHSQPAHDKLLWDKDAMAEQGPPTVPYETVMGYDSGLRSLVRHILTVGVAVVSGTPTDGLAPTRRLCERVGLLQATMYGQFWQFSSDQTGHPADTAYSSEGLGVHTDGTYFSYAPGIQVRVGVGVGGKEARLQVFHCMQQGIGGQTRLVDGFEAARQLRKVAPEDYDFLRRLPVPHHFLDAGAHVRCDHLPVLRVHPTTSQLLQIRYNPYDRAPLSTDIDDTEQFYRSYGRLSAIINDAANVFEVQQAPGNTFFIDNWRVLHGRAPFSGPRKIAGCYLSMDDFISKARILGAY